jgi:hypothetical protein
MIGIGLWLERPWAPLPVYTGGTAAVRFRCLSAVQSRLREIAWPDVHDPGGGDDISLESESIIVKKWPSARVYERKDEPVALPCILITPGLDAGMPTSGPTTSDDYVRPCVVTMIMMDNAEPTLLLNLDVMELWREKVMHAFQNQRLPGVTEAIICHVKPSDPVNLTAWGHNVLASTVTLNFTCREPRGLT